MFELIPNTIKKVFGEIEFFKLVVYGQVGFLTETFPWELIDKVDILKELANVLDGWTCS